MTGGDELIEVTMTDVACYDDDFPCENEEYPAPDSRDWHEMFSLFTALKMLAGGPDNDRRER